jgi:multidrug efflux pump subunit AcrB
MGAGKPANGQFFMLLIMVIGSLSYTLLPRNEDPAFTIKTAVVSAQWPGASVTDTTHLVTDVLRKITGNALARLYRK